MQWKPALSWQSSPPSHLRSAGTHRGNGTCLLRSASMKLRFPLLALSLFLLGQPLLAADLLPPTTPIPEAITHYIELQWKEQDVKPAALADDTTFIRRATLDLCGRIPTP